MSAALKCAAEMEKAIDFQARAWDAAKELRAQHALILQMLEALRTCRVNMDGTRFKEATWDHTKVSQAIAAAESRT